MEQNIWACSVSFQAKVYFSYYTFSYSLLRLVIGVVFFALVFAATLLTKTINKSDIENLGAMEGGLGIVGKMFSRVLNIYEKLMETLKP